MTRLGSRERRGNRRKMSQTGRLRVEALEGRLLLAVVTNLDDAGAGSLRQAIIDTNASPTDNTITFDIATPAGLKTIELSSPLPAITDAVSIIGPAYLNSAPQIELVGTNAGAGANGLVLTAGNSTVSNLAIRDFDGNGILISGTGGNRINGMFLGVRPDGSSGSNGQDGLRIDNSPNNTIGGTTSAARNVIGFNVDSGIRILGANATENRVENNAIGTNLGGNVNQGNRGAGVLIDGAARNTVGGTATGMPNTIAFNGASGIMVLSGDLNSFRRNSLFENSGRGIELAPGTNGNIPTPILTLANTEGANTIIRGTLTGARASSSYILEVFSNTSTEQVEGTTTSEGRTFISSQSITTDASGNATINLTTTAITLGQYVTVTATDPDGNTSEFSNPQLNVASSADLALDGVVSPNPVARNGYLEYVYTVSNPGPNAIAATFRTTLPSTLSFVQATATSGAVTRTGSTVQVAFTALPVNQTQTIRVQVVPTTTGTIDTTATIEATQDPNAANNTKALSVQVVSGINLVVNGSTTPDPARVGEEMAFRFVVTNSGETTSTANAFRSQLPPNFTFVSASTSQGTVLHDPAIGMVTAAFGPLGVNASALVTIVGRPEVVGTMGLIGSALGDPSQPEVDTSNNAASVILTVQPQGTPTPPDSIAPRVVSLRRWGIGHQPSSLLVGFSEQLNVSSAEDLTNYQFVSAGRDHRFDTADDVRLPIATANYDTARRAVILTTRHPFRLGLPVRLTINGTTETGVRDLNGQLLDGSGSGTPGSNFVRAFRGLGPGDLPAIDTRTLARRGLARLR